MNKTDFANKLSKRVQIPRSQAIVGINAAIDILTEAMVEKEKVQFIGFGSLEPKYSPQRLARNPRTKETVVIPAGNKPTFKSSELLRRKVNPKKD